MQRILIENRKKADSIEYCLTGLSKRLTMRNVVFKFSVKVRIWPIDASQMHEADSVQESLTAGAVDKRK